MNKIEYEKNYIVYSDGRIYDKKRGVFKKTSHDKDGYLKTTINGKTMRVHRIVMYAFYGKSNLVVDHLDLNKENNNLNNLEYVTVSENNKRMLKHYGNIGGVKRSKKVLWNNKEYNSAR